MGLPDGYLVLLERLFRCYLAGHPLEAFTLGLVRGALLLLVPEAGVEHGHEYSYSYPLRP